MGIRRPSTIAVIAALMLGGVGAARAGHSLYDVNMLLSQPHPFATPGPAAPQSPASPVSAPPPPPAPVLRQSPPPPAATPLEPADLDERGLAGVISEVRLGALIHDEGPFSSHKEADSVDVNLEVQFVSPEVLEVIGSPRPHLGADINTVGDTSSFYFGLTYEWDDFDVWKGFFIGFSIGGAYHDGETNNAPADRKELGCSLLFRGSFEFGYRFWDTHGISLMLDHISYAKLCDHNEGLENVGLRYGYRF